jgi:DNA replication and repair protein RecF
VLGDFRCHQSLEFRPEPGVNVLIGPNGAGKTSVLEAIGFASTLRSFRRTTDGSLIRTDAAEAIIRVGLETPAGERKIEIALPSEGRRQVLLNGKRPRSNADLNETLPVVAFLPDDLDLMKGGPGRRRDFLDELAGQLSPEAGAVQAEYARALRQRNTLLKQEGRNADQVTLSVWDERVSTAGGSLVAHRLRLLDRLDPVLGSAYRSVSGDSIVTSVYESRWARSLESRDGSVFADELFTALEERRSRDLELRVTSVGPHRDEPSFDLDGRVVRNQASQGEQRSVALALRLASYRLLEERHNAAPVLLLDDVFSELDVSRAEGVMEILPRGQVFVTSAREDEVPVAGRRWNVEAGSLT